jgi:hypothetical protein
MVSAWMLIMLPKYNMGTKYKWGSNKGTFYDGTVTTCSTKLALK